MAGPLRRSPLRVGRCAEPTIPVVRLWVLIVDDSPNVRQELRTLLPLCGFIEIVGEAADGLEAIRLAEALRPHVILIDLEMPVLSGYDATREIKARWPCCRVVALTICRRIGRG